jgi:hypothetical protein
VLAPVPPWFARVAAPVAAPSTGAPWARTALDPARWIDEYEALYRRLLDDGTRRAGAR